MPKSPPKACFKPGCLNITYGTYCKEHQKEEHKRDIRHRGTAAERGYGHAWKKARDVYLRQSPLCAECMRNGIIRTADLVDHIIPHNNDKELFWNRDNWQGLCTPCHNVKTAKERRAKNEY